MIMKNDIEDLVRERLKLPDNAVINSANLRITYASEEIELIGKVSVEFSIEEDPQELEVSALIETKGKRGKLGGLRKREKGNTVLKRRLSADNITPKKGSALPGMGSKITDAQVKGYKAVLHGRKHIKKLTDNQLAALQGLEGVRVAKMTPEQRQQLKDIHDESTPKKGE